MDSSDRAKANSLTDAQIQSWRAAFYRIVDKRIELQHLGSNILSFEKFKTIKNVIIELKTGVTKERRRELRELHSVLNRWEKNYDVIQLLGNDEPILVYKPELKKGSTIPSLDQYKQVKHYGCVFEALFLLHHIEGKDHKKSHSLYAASQKKFGKSIPRWCAQALGDTCPVCISQRMSRKEPTGGCQPILSRDLRATAQIGLIDFQSMPDGDFKYLIVYRDYCMNLCKLYPLRKKTSTDIAQKLIEIFTFIGPPAILQADNYKELYNTSFDGKVKRDILSEEFLADVIDEVKRMWPGCFLHQGRPEQSESSGDVEGLTYDIETKLENWMCENKSTSWALGCNFVQWYYNAQVHKKFKKGVNQNHLAFSQKPHVGVRNLSIGHNLVPCSLTEMDLNESFTLRHERPIEETETYLDKKSQQSS